MKAVFAWIALLLLAASNAFAQPKADIATQCAQCRAGVSSKTP